VALLRLEEIQLSSPQSSRNMGLFDKPRERAPVVRSFEQQGADVVRQARERAAEIEKDAYECGYAQGEKDGLHMGEKRFEGTAQTLRALMGEVANVRRSLIAESSQEIFDLAMGLARAIIRAEVSCGAEVALRAAQEALGAMAAEANVVIKLNPHNLDYLKERGLLPEGAVFEPAPAITSGGCIAESDRERFDARLERQMATLEAALRAEMARVSQAGGQGQAG
jgi:flagellar assembly protein FliH